MQIKGLAGASVCLGFLSMILFWWFPHGLVLACAGFVLGVISMLLGVRGGNEGENFALTGTLFSLYGGTAAYTCFRLMQIIMWDH
jgi:hypothetical protein